MKKYLSILSLFISIQCTAQDWPYTPFSTTTPYPTKMKILKIGTVDMSLPENECPAKNWSFYAGDNYIPFIEYKSTPYNKGIVATWKVAGWTMQELKAIEDSANGITYSFEIEVWYDTVKPKVFYGIAGIKKQPIDSSKYYYRRYLFFRSKIAAEIIRISNSTHEDGIMDDFLRFQDSAVEYKLKLEKVIKK